MEQNHHVMVFMDSYGPFQRVVPVLHVTGEHPESAGEINCALNDPTRSLRVGTVSREVPEAIFLRQLETANWIIDLGAAYLGSNRFLALPCLLNPSGLLFSHVQLMSFKKALSSRVLSA